MRSTKFMGILMLLTGLGMLIWGWQAPIEAGEQALAVYRYIAGSLLTAVGAWIVLKKKPA